MDLRQYFRKLRETQMTITDAEVFVTSLETGDGGKAGVVTEVPRDVAAKMLVEARAVLSSKAERQKFLEQQAVAREAARTAEVARKLQLTVVASSEPQRSFPPANAEGNSRK